MAFQVPANAFPRTVAVWLKGSLPVLGRTTENRDPSRLPPQPGARTDRTKRGTLRQCVAARLDSADGPTGWLRFEPGGGGRCLACAQAAKGTTLDLRARDFGLAASARSSCSACFQSSKGFPAAP